MPAWGIANGESSVSANENDAQLSKVKVQKSRQTSVGHPRDGKADDCAPSQGRGAPQDAPTEGSGAPQQAIVAR